ncbi:MAG: hypothetical protein ACI9KE_002788 [Polyangiales bacterium]
MQLAAVEFVVGEAGAFAFKDERDTSTWTNIAMDSSGVLSGDVADPIGGTLNIATYDESVGMLDVTFA